MNPKSITPYEECIGCKELQTDGLCSTIPDVLIEECPCCKCLVKSMCEIPCKEYNHFLNTEVDKYYGCKRIKEQKDAG